jgi:hypothetical protein
MWREKRDCKSGEMFAEMRVHPSLENSSASPPESIINATML